MEPDDDPEAAICDDPQGIADNLLMHTLKGFATLRDTTYLDFGVLPMILNIKRIGEPNDKVPPPPLALSLI